MNQLNASCVSLANNIFFFRLPFVHISFYLTRSSLLRENCRKICAFSLSLNRALALVYNYAEAKRNNFRRFFSYLLILLTLLWLC